MSKENLTYSELTDLVSRVPSSELGITTPEQRRYINKELLRGLRGLDCLSRSKLLTLIRALSREQSHTRLDCEDSLYRFVALIDQVEKAVKEENLSRKITSKVLELSPEKKRDMLEYLEQPKPESEKYEVTNGISVSHSLPQTEPKLKWQYPFWVNDKGERFCPRCYEGKKRVSRMVLKDYTWICVACDWELSAADAQDELETES